LIRAALPELEEVVEEEEEEEEEELLLLLLLPVATRWSARRRLSSLREPMQSRPLYASALRTSPIGRAEADCPSLKFKQQELPDSPLPPWQDEVHSKPFLPHAQVLHRPVAHAHGIQNKSYKILVGKIKQNVLINYPFHHGARDYSLQL
jgi:hypothetical protein